MYIYNNKILNDGANNFLYFWSNIYAREFRTASQNDKMFKNMSIFFKYFV